MAFARSGKLVSQMQREMYFGLCRKLGFDDDQRREQLRQVAHVSSSKELDRRGMAIVIDDLMRRAGQKPGSRRPHEQTKASGDEPKTPRDMIVFLARKINWDEAQLLAWLSSSRSPLAAFNRFRPVPWRLEELSERQERQVIEALKALAGRIGRKAAVK
jgi:hypothetical protein